MRRKATSDSRTWAGPIQAKARIAAPYRAAFDYHCRLDMPADPIRPATRADCLF